ncbi:MAG: hypothetical protein AAF512_00340 [Pseudomonadota bacterium]
MTHILRNLQNIDVQELEAASHVITSHQTLSEVVAWVASLGQNDALSEIITQDEFTHDVIVKFTENAYLIYDVT